VERQILSVDKREGDEKKKRLQKPATLNIWWSLTILRENCGLIELVGQQIRELQQIITLAFFMSCSV